MAKTHKPDPPESDIAPLTTPVAEPVPSVPTEVVTGVEVKALGRHEHDGEWFEPGATFIIGDPKLAATLEGEGAVSIIHIKSEPL